MPSDLEALAEQYQRHAIAWDAAPAGISHQVATEMDAGLQQRLPGVEVVILAADGMTVYRPDEQTEVDDA